MSFTSTITIDGNFQTAREVEGGPLVTTDETTGAIMVTRQYCVLRNNYQPLTQGIPDVRFTNAYLVGESPVSVGNGPMYFFTRTFCQVPDPRTEPRLIVFARPGVSSVEVSTLSGNFIGWNQYGQAAPNVRAISGSVAYSYINAPGISSSPFAEPAITQITYKGAPVDFVGSVYVYKGTKQVASNGNLISEPYWLFEGVTNPSIMPTSWVQDVQVSRWRGTIWEMQVTTVPVSAF